MATFSANSRLNMMNLKERKSQNMGETNTTLASSNQYSIIDVGSGLTINDN